MSLSAGELLVGPAKTLFLDEISTGLDSNTTFQIMRSLRHFAHIQQATMLIALLQPTPETYHLFDDIMLLSEGDCPFELYLLLCQCRCTWLVALAILSSSLPPKTHNLSVDNMLLSEAKMHALACLAVWLLTCMCT